jgi:hypothetical protein
MKRDALLDEVIYAEDECGVILYNLTVAELKIVARVCTALANLPEDERDELYDELNPDRIEANEVLYDDDESELN